MYEAGQGTGRRKNTRHSGSERRFRVQAGIAIAGLSLFGGSVAMATRVFLWENEDRAPVPTTSAAPIIADCEPKPERRLSKPEGDEPVSQLRANELLNNIAVAEGVPEARQAQARRYLLDLTCEVIEGPAANPHVTVYMNAAGAAVWTRADQTSAPTPDLYKATAAFDGLYTVGAPFNTPPASP